MNKIKGSDLMVKALENEGVEYIFGIPGEENLDFLNSLKNSNIKLILTRNEQSAVFMAATYARYTGKPGIALSTLGPGATNLVTGVGYAQLNALPVILLTGQKPIKKSKQGEFQIIDVVSMMEPLTKWATQIKNANKITTTIRQAFKLALNERMGAVHIELPEDIASEYADSNLKPLPIQKIRRPVVEDRAFEMLIEDLEKAKKPIILIGAGANRKQVSKYLTKFVTKYNIPFFESQMGKGVVDETLKQYIGTAALSDNDGVHKAVKEADLILAIGHDVIEKPTNFVNIGETKTVHINYYEAKVDEVYAPEHEIIGDIGNLFWRLVEEVKLNTKNWNHENIYKISRIEKEKKINSMEKEEFNKIMMPRKFVKELREVLDKKDILALDNGWYKIWIARNYETHFPNTVLLDNTFATMGAGVSTGMMAKFLNKEQNVVTITGDGGFLMNLGDLETAVRLGIDMTIVLINNNSYGMIKVKQAHAGFDEFGLDLPNPDFIQLAQSFGAQGFKVESKEEFKPLLEKTLKMKGIKIIELPFEYPTEVD